MSATFDPPRWLNGPRICVAANLPAFATPAEMDAFKTANSPGTLVVARWRCKACGDFHYWGTGGDPAGGSSGTTRTSKHIAEVKAKFLASATAKTMR